MSDQIETVSEQGLGGNLMDSIKGVAVGALLAGKAISVPLGIVCLVGSVAMASSFGERRHFRAGISHQWTGLVK